MSRLSDIQRRFSRAVMAPSKAWQPDELSLRDQPPVPFTERVEIYHYAYSARIGESLEDDFAAVIAWIGKASFSSRVRPYLERFPSRYRTLSLVSQNFSEFLRLHPHPEDPPFLPELARFEWTWISAAMTDNRVGNVSPLTLMAEPDLTKCQIMLAPSLRFFESDWPVDKLLRGPRSTSSVIAPSPVKLVFFRNTQNQIDWLRLRPRQFALVQILSKASNVQEALTEIEKNKIPASMVQSCMAYWTRKGIILGLR